MKTIYCIFGTISLILGSIGIFLPLLPTTPFLLLSAFLYSKGSKRLHHWLLTNRTFGEYIRNYTEHRAIKRRSRNIAITMMWTAMIYSSYMVGNIWMAISLLVIAVGVTIHLFTLNPI